MIELNVWFWVLGSTVLVSLISFVGVLALAFKEKVLDKLLLALVALSAGALMGGAFFHLLPEALEETPGAVVAIFVYLLAGFTLFFLLEKILFWRHCHRGKCDVHTFTYMNLVGDAVHNFVDGLIIAAAYLASIPLGIVTTLAVIAHEIPQELGDFGVLVYGGFKKLKALFYNFVTALTAIVGAVVGLLLSGYVENIAVFLLPFAAGGFIYIAGSDLIPELHKEPDIKKSFASFAFFLVGLLLMWLLLGLQVH